jgi:pyridoxamine 5'-phosphate oxidase family protein
MSDLFSEAEANYLKTQRLARVATASSKGTPEVSPVGFEFDGKYFWVGSHSQDIFHRTRRYRNITAGNNRVSIVIDDLVSVNPWKPRGVKVRGTAEIKEHKGIFGDGKYIRISPVVSVSWGIEQPKGKDWASVKRWK